MLSTKDILGIAQPDVLVGKCERVGREENLDEIEGNAKKDDKSPPFVPTSARY
jgi:hypothetical protein